METVKSFYFKVNLKGRGVVNEDGDNMKYFLARQYKNNYGTATSPYDNDNVTIAKSNYYDGGKIRKLKISSDCIKRNLFKDLDMNGLANSRPEVQQYFLASPTGQLRGYMFAEKETNGVVRKSPFCLTDAEDDGNTVINPETYSTSGDRNKTSYYVKETVGDVEYSASGSINVRDLFFLSASEFYGRMGVKEEWVEDTEEPSIFQKTMTSLYGSLPYTTGCYTRFEKILSDKVGEFGLHFNENYVKKMIVDFFTRLLEIHIEKHKAFAEIESLEIKPVFDCVRDKFFDDNGWIKVKTVEDVESVVNKCEIEDCWVRCSNQTESKELHDNIISQGKKKPVVSVSEAANESSDVEKKPKGRAKSKKNDD